MFAIRRCYRCVLPVRRLFSETPVVKIVENGSTEAEAVAKITADNAAKGTKLSIETVSNPVKVESQISKTEKVVSKKKRSVVKPFLVGCVFTLFAGYFFVYKQIWDSAHQMEQSIADLNVDMSDSIDKLEQRVSKLESQQ